MSNRLERINSEVHKTLTQILANELKDPRLTGFVTITEVKVSGDLSHCKVFITILASSEKEKSQTFKILKDCAPFIRKSLAQKLNMRLTPEIHFFLDETWEEGIKMDKLLDSISQSGDK